MIIGLLLFTATLPVYVRFSSIIFNELFRGVELMFAMFMEAL